MLALAAVLRDIDCDVVPDGLRERTFPAQSISDDFELAEALVRADSVAAALRVLDRSCLALLRFVEVHRGLPAEGRVRQMPRASVPVKRRP